MNGSFKFPSGRRMLARLRLLLWLGSTLFVCLLSVLRPTGVEANGNQPIFSVQRWSNGTFPVAAPLSIGTWVCDANGGGATCFTPVRSVHMLSADRGWAVGDNGLILEYRNGGWDPILETQQGELVPHIPTSARLNAVEMLSPQEGWAVGEGVILHYQNGTWRSVASPTQKALLALDMLSTTEGWAVGEGGMIIRYVSGSWQVVQEDGSSLLSISMASAEEGWTVGEGGAILQYSDGVWQSVSSPTSEHLHDVQMLSSAEGWAVGENGTILHYSNGYWVVESGDEGLVLTAINMLSPISGWAVGQQPSQYSTEAVFLDYQQGIWTKSTSSYVKSMLLDLSVVAVDEGWAVGEGGMLVHLAGKTWQPVTSEPQSSIFELTGVDMLTPNEGWAVGTSHSVASILHYVDGVWPPPQRTVGPTARAVDLCCSRYTSVSFISQGEGWATRGPFGLEVSHFSGGHLMDSTRFFAPAWGSMSDVEVLPSGEGWAVGQAGTIVHRIAGEWQVVSGIGVGGISGDNLLAVDVLSSEDAWVVGNQILHYTEGVWGVLDNPSGQQLTGISMISPDEGWAVGVNGTILHYSQGVWHTAPSPTLVNLWAVSMVSPVDGWAVGEKGIILRYDGGVWQRVPSPTVMSLYDLDIVSATEGWAVGQQGVRVHYQAKYPLYLPNVQNWQELSRDQ